MPDNIPTAEHEEEYAEEGGHDGQEGEADALPHLGVRRLRGGRGVQGASEPPAGRSPPSLPAPPRRG